MKNNFQWILLLILPYILVTKSRSVPIDDSSFPKAYDYDALNKPKPEEERDITAPNSEQVISVRITSSVAIGRNNGKTDPIPEPRETRHEPPTTIDFTNPTEPTSIDFDTVFTETTLAETGTELTNTTPNLSGANIEFIKQLHAKKETRGLQQYEQIHPFQNSLKLQSVNETEDSIAESSIKSEYEIPNETYAKVAEENVENVPLARSVPRSHSNNFVQGFNRKPPSERGNARLTTVSFNVVHDTPQTATSNYNEPRPYIDSNKPSRNVRLSAQYNQPSKVYSQPAQIYSEPAKFYSEPAKIYSEPAKIYSEPAKIYSEPAKIYSEPAKFYSQPASLHLNSDAQSIPWQPHPSSPSLDTVSTTPPATNGLRNSPNYSEQSYEVEEKEGEGSDGRSQGSQESNENCKQDNCKVGYVVEGRQYRKYRVEERTADGFIVGEYGVVRNEDGALRGVRYTADSDASPRLIYDALMKFLQL